MADPLSRREFIRRYLSALGAAALASCTSAPPTRDPSVPTYGPGTARDPIARIDTQWPIKRIVYLMQENRSFDHLFGRFPGANGVTTGIRDGREVPLGRCPEWLPTDLPHDYLAAIDHINGGAMDGFASTVHGRSAPRLRRNALHFAYTQLDREDVPNYWHWAGRNVLCDNFFASAVGPSFPNHLYFIAGTSVGTFDTPSDIKYVPLGGRYNKTWGCDANPEAYVLTRNEDGKIRRERMCFDVETVGDQLTSREIPWAHYAARPSQRGYFWNAYTSIRQIFHDREAWATHIRPVDRLIGDIRAGALPAVTWVTPRFELSDHVPWSSCHAHDWITAVVNAIMRSPMWEHTAIFITWDEWGGFYDHVPPPKLDFFGLGIRVPMLLISPYAKEGLVDHEVGEFSSPLKFVEDNWRLPHLTPRIERTHNFAHAFDFDAPPRPPDPLAPRGGCMGEAFEKLEDHPDWPAEFRTPSAPSSP
jgi:phospholipase C